MSEQMTSRERVLTSLSHHEPDRVPCWLGTSPEWKGWPVIIWVCPTTKPAGTPGRRFPTGVPSYAGPSGAPDHEPDEPDATYRTPFGVERYGYGYGMPLHEPLKDVRRWPRSRVRWPDPEWIDVSHIREDALKYDREYAILGGEWSPFWHDAIDLLGFDGLIYADARQPGVVEAVISRWRTTTWPFPGASSRPGRCH